MNEAQRMYEKYRKRFAQMYHHSIKYATKCQQVKSYKEYLEKVFHVTIDESVNDGVDQ